MDFAALLKDRIDLSRIPFGDRSARMMFFCGNQPPAPGTPPAGFFAVRLAERWEKQQAEVGHYRQRRPVIDQLVFVDANENPLPIQLTTYPHAVAIDTPAGRVQLCFADVLLRAASRFAGPALSRARRAGQTFFDQAAACRGVSFMGANADDVSGSPVRGGAFIAFRWTHTRRADATLMTAKHPHARQSGKQTQFGFVLNIDIGAARRMVQKPCNCAFF